MNFSGIGGGGGGPVTGGGPGFATTGGSAGCGGAGGGGFGWNRNGLRSTAPGAGRAALSASSLTSSSDGSSLPWPRRAGAAVALDDGAWGAVESVGHNQLAINATTATPSTIRSHGRGRPVAAVSSVAIAPGLKISRDLHRHVQRGRRLGALRQRDVLEHQELRCGLQLVDELPDVAILARQGDRRRQLAERAVALLRVLVGGPLVFHVGLLRELVDVGVGDPPRVALVGRQHLSV